MYTWNLERNWSCSSTTRSSRRQKVQWKEETHRKGKKEANGEIDCQWQWSEYLSNVNLSLNQSILEFQNRGLHSRSSPQYVVQEIGQTQESPSSNLVVVGHVVDRIVNCCVIKKIYFIEIYFHSWATLHWQNSDSVLRHNNSNYKRYSRFDQLILPRLERQPCFCTDHRELIHRMFFGILHCRPTFFFCPYS